MISDSSNRSKGLLSGLLAFTTAVQSFCKEYGHES